jgi:hypothetical protein
LKVHPVVFGELTLKRRWGFARTDPRAVDLCVEKVLWRRDASTTKDYAPKPGEKKGAPVWQGIPEKFASDSFLFFLYYWFCRCQRYFEATAQQQNRFSF